MIRTITLLLFLFCTNIMYSQYSIKLGMGFDYISQVPHDDKTPNSKFIMGEYQVSPTWAIGLGYRRFVNSNSFGGLFSTSFQSGDIIYEGREDGEIRSNEFFVSVIKSVSNFSLQYDVGYVRSKKDTRFYLQNLNRSDDSIISSGYFNKTYQWTGFFRSALSLEYNLSIIDQLDLVPYFQFMLDLWTSETKYPVESIEDIPEDFLSPRFNEFNKTYSGMNPQRKYFVFGVALKYDFGK